MFFIKKPLLLSLLSGVLLTLSWPVSGFSFLIFVGLIPLFFSDHIISKDNKKSVSKNLKLVSKKLKIKKTW